MRISTVVTRVGDKGTTRLVGNVEVSKDSARIHCYGTVDELNACLGMAAAELDRNPQGVVPDRVQRDRMREELELIQHQLFDLGADLATPVSGRWEGFRAMEERHVKALESRLEAYLEDLEPLQEFVLPGGTPLAAALHLARTVCRRAERLGVRLVDAEGEQVNGQAVIYLNRLSDHLFVLARWANRAASHPERLWKRDLAE